MYPEMPKTSIMNGVMQAIEIIIPKRKSNGEKEQVQTTITAVITNTIKPLKQALSGQRHRFTAEKFLFSRFQKKKKKIKHLKAKTT